MLTKDDLITIGQVIDQRFDKRLEPLSKEIKDIKSDLRKVQKDVRVMLAVLNRADVELYKRVERIEEHLGLSKLQ
jgi:hypothetical protein